MRSTHYQFNVDSIGENLNRFKLIYTKKKRNNAQQRGIFSEDELLSEDLVTYVNRNDNLIVELESIEDDIDSVELFDIRGRSVATFQASETKNVSHLKSGIYLTVVRLESGRKMSKKIAILP
jgi:hypothetical protein